MTHHRAQRPHAHDSLPADTRRGRGIVAVVGRPNVGKSTLFNRLAGARISIVHDEPGVTRDRHYADAMAFGYEYTLIDTGGFDPQSDDRMQQGIARHVRAAIAEADVILCVLDGTTEPTSADREAVKLLRQSSKPVVYAANKVDGPRIEGDAMELYRLGLPELYLVSALHGRGIGELETELIRHLDELHLLGETPVDEEGSEVPRIALVGRPNAGKSSLLNRLTGQERSLVDDRPGTTRDTVDALVTVQLKGPEGTFDQRLVVLDTAGIRKKSKVSETIEGISVMRAIRAMEQAEVVVLMVDANEGVGEQDAKILGLAVDRGRPVVVALNKCDLLDKRELEAAEQAVREALAFAKWAEIVRISAKTGRGVQTLLSRVLHVRANWSKRITTGELNRFFETTLETHPPPTNSGRAVRLYYISQVQVRPPTFAIVTNDPTRVHFSYQRYVQNRITEHFGFEGTPVRVRYRAKRRRSDPQE